MWVCAALPLDGLPFKIPPIYGQSGKKKHKPVVFNFITQSDCFLSQKNTINSNRFDYGRNIKPTSFEILKVRRKAFAYIFRSPCCSSVTTSYIVFTYWVATVVLFLLGVMLLALAVYYKRRQQSTTSRVAISLPD